MAAHSTDVSIEERPNDEQNLCFESLRRSGVNPLVSLSAVQRHVLVLPASI